MGRIEISGKSFDIDAGMKTEEGSWVCRLLGTDFLPQTLKLQMFDTGQMKKSEGIGGNIMPVYLKIQNPYLDAHTGNDGAKFS